LRHELGYVRQRSSCSYDRDRVRHCVVYFPTGNCQTSGRELSGRMVIFFFREAENVTSQPLAQHALPECALCRDYEPINVPRKAC
jgi:hypothetical protein